VLTRDSLSSVSFSTVARSCWLSCAAVENRWFLPLCASWAAVWLASVPPDGSRGLALLGSRSGSAAELSNCLVYVGRVRCSAVPGSEFGSRSCDRPLRFSIGPPSVLSASSSYGQHLSNRLTDVWVFAPSKYDVLPHPVCVHFVCVSVSRCTSLRA
jgi:hypothetical protein